MPVARYQLEDGRIARFEVPEGTTPEQAQSIGAQYFAQQAQPQGVSPEASAMAAEGMSLPQTLAVGAGRGFDKLAMGLKQAVLGGVSKYGPESLASPARAELDAQAQQEAEKDQAYAALQQQRPIATGAGEAVPSVMATGGAGMVPAAIASGGMEAMKYGTPEERMSSGLAGAAGSAVGSAVGGAVGRTIAPHAGSAFNSVKSEALRLAEALGVKPRLSQVTASPLIARMEDLASQTPGGSGVMQDFAQSNQKALNKAAANSIGERADELSPKVLSDASSRLGKVFNEIKELPGRPIAISKDVGTAADDILRQQAKMLPQEQDQNLISLAKNIKALSANGGKIDGETYQLTRSGLSNQAFEASGTTKAHYGQLLEALDNSAEQSLTSAGNKELAQALRTVRPQYGNLKTLEKGMIAEGGDVNPARLASALRAKDPKGFREGKSGELYDIGRMSETLKPLREGSQTYGREASSDVASLAIKAPLAYALAKATTSPAMTAYPGMLAKNPTAAKLAELVSQPAKPASRAVANAIARQLLIGSPVMAEQQ